MKKVVLIGILLVLSGFVYADKCKNDPQCTDAKWIEPVTREQAQVWVDQMVIRYGPDSVILAPDKDDCTNGYFPCSTHMCESFIRKGFKSHIQEEIKFSGYDLTVFKIKVNSSPDYLWCNSEDNLGYMSEDISLAKKYANTFLTRKEPETREEMQVWINEMEQKYGYNSVTIFPGHNGCNDGHFPCDSTLLCFDYMVNEFKQHGLKHMIWRKYSRPIIRIKFGTLYPQLPGTYYILCSKNDRFGINTGNKKLIQEYADTFLESNKKRNLGRRIQHRQLGGR